MWSLGASGQREQLLLESYWCTDWCTKEVFLSCCHLVVIGMERDKCCDQAIEIVEIFHLSLILTPARIELTVFYCKTRRIAPVVLKWKMMLGGDGKGNWKKWWIYVLSFVCYS